MRVLDLITGWNLHIPGSITDLEITALGMNREEMERNRHLSSVLVHDLNREPDLPFDGEGFDAAPCTVSVEYLVRPVKVFSEMARVLKSGALFGVAFSDRWFPPRVVRIWMELHPFERMGLVIDYFRKSGRFTELRTESLRGRSRPANDRYAAMTPFTDPVYAVWGRVAAG